MQIKEDPSVRIAKINRLTGDIYINPDIPQEYRPFILAHELGHYYLQTHNEFDADKYALDKILGKFKGSLRGSAKALLLLNPENPEHRERIRKGLLQIALTDYLVFHNPKALKIMETVNIKLKPKHEQALKMLLVSFLRKKGYQKISNLPKEKREEILKEFLADPLTGHAITKILPAYDEHFSPGDEEYFDLFDADDLEIYDEFLGLSKREREERRKRREERRKAREERRKLRMERKRAKIDAIKAGRIKPGEKLSQIANAVTKIAAPVAAAVGPALGLPPSVSSGIVTAIGTGVEMAAKPPQTNTQQHIQYPQNYIPNTQRPQTQPQTDSKEKQQDKDIRYHKKEDKKMWYLIILLIVLVAGGGVFFVFKR